MIDPDWSFDRSRLKLLLIRFEAMIDSDQEAWLIVIEVLIDPEWGNIWLGFVVMIDSDQESWLIGIEVLIDPDRSHDWLRFVAIIDPDQESW
jgi:RNA polymerase subunit RPABC4/transcription elongation factor Spt4